jgi:hypothetical protein
MIMADIAASSITSSPPAGMKERLIKSLKVILWHYK